ncbi:MAG: SMC-Scp complex subunit ScpB [Polyangiaceae bacterium]|nr:SMC-Scp complex subunit ScpB [Polyangiaceae bacterium]
MTTQFAMTPSANDDGPRIFRSRARAWFKRHGQPAAKSEETQAPAQPAAPSLDVVREHLRGVVEALLFASDKPMTIGELCKTAKAERKMMKSVVEELSAFYKNRGFRLDEIAGGYAFRTSPAYSPFVRELTGKKPVKMSRAQIETLAIVAYRQPITRPEIDDVRGVDSGAVLKALLDRDLVRILGKRDEPGRPIIYGTTPEFLKFFGLKSLSDLPTLREFAELTDESRMTFQREMGEEAPELGKEDPGGFAGGEGAIESHVVEGDAEPSMSEGEGEEASELPKAAGESEDEPDEEDEDEDESDDEDESEEDEDESDDEDESEEDDDDDSDEDESDEDEDESEEDDDDSDEDEDESDEDESDEDESDEDEDEDESDEDDDDDESDEDDDDEDDEDENDDDDDEDEDDDEESDEDDDDDESDEDDDDEESGEDDDESEDEDEDDEKKG